MHPIRKQRLIVVTLIVVLSSLAIGLVVFALKDNLNSFYPPSKFQSGKVPKNVRIRAGGCVKPGSLIRENASLKIMFTLMDSVAELPVQYEGILPDLFSEGEASVVHGKWHDDNVFYADQVLAKHDENYMPPEVASTIDNSEGTEHQATCEGMNYDS